MEQPFVEGGENRRVLRDYAAPNVVGTTSGIRRPTVQANNFEIKPSFIQMVQSNQFGGMSKDDPNAHIAYFLEVCDLYKINGVSEDVVRLRVFPFSLWDKAKEWLNSLPPRSITTWNELVQKKCPHHGIPIWLPVSTYYNGLVSNYRAMIDAAAGGSLMGKTPEDAHELLEIMAENNNQWHSERVTTKRPATVHEIDSVNALSAQVAVLSRKMDSLSSKLESKPTVECDLYGGNHASIECQVGNPFASPNAEQANYVSNFQRPQHNPYSNTYNPGWRNHPNLSWGNNQGGFKPSSSSYQPQEKKQIDLEGILGKFIEESRTNFRNQKAINRDIQNQLGQLSKQIAERSQGSLPSDTINPKEHAKAITLRSGKELEWQRKSKKKMEESKEKHQHLKMFNLPQMQNMSLLSHILKD
ncbi:hypothetical protein UlMin_042223 [Ulmus minor]